MVGYHRVGAVCDLRARKLHFALSLIGDPLFDLLDGPAAHPPLLFLLLLHWVAQAEVLRHSARVVLPAELQAVVDDVTRLFAVVERGVCLLLLVVLEVLGLAHMPYVFLVVELLPVLGLVVLVDVVPYIVQVVVIHVVPVLKLLDEARRKVFVVEVLDEERSGLAVGGVRETLLLELPYRGNLFAVELVQRSDRLAPLTRTEGEREGFAAVDGGELRCKLVRWSRWDASVSS